MSYLEISLIPVIQTIKNLSSEITSNSDDFKNFEKILIKVVGSIGILFNSLNIFHFLFRCTKSQSARASELIAYMNFSSLINTISYMLYFTNNKDYDDDNNNPLCKIQGSLMVFSELSELATATIISVYIYNNIFDLESNEIHNSKRFLKIFFGFLLPLILSGLGYLFDIFGINGNWCWIKGNLANQIIAPYFVFYWIVLLFNISLIGYSYFKIRSLLNTHHENHDQIIYEMSHLKIMSTFPLMIIICWILPTIKKIMFFYTNEKNDIIEIFGVSMILLLGFFISGTSFFFIKWKSLFKEFLSCFKKMCSCNKKVTENTRMTENCLLDSMDLGKNRIDGKYI